MTDLQAVFGSEGTGEWCFVVHRVTVDWPPARNNCQFQLWRCSVKFRTDFVHGFFFFERKTSAVFEITCLDVRFRRAPMCAKQGYTALLRTNNTRTSCSRSSCSVHTSYVRCTCACRAHGTHVRQITQPARRLCSTPSGFDRPTTVVQRFWQSFFFFFVGCLLRTVCIVFLFCCPVARVAFFT